MNKKKIGVIGATGYTGSEIVRILSQHPGVEIALITSEARAGEKFSDVHPFFQGIVDDVLHPADKVDDTELDLVFLALPHGVSMEYVKRFAGRGFRMVDFSGDFRLGSAEIYEQWYPKKHVWPDGFRDAAYGLPELFADAIREAPLVANPGCFPTGAILALAPLVEKRLVAGDGIIIDSKTGVTGAGIKASSTNMFSNVNDNFKAYGVKTHRHTIEIQQILEELAGRPSGSWVDADEATDADTNTDTDTDTDTNQQAFRKPKDAIAAGTADAFRKDQLSPVQFTPHLLPVDRGILTTAYARPAAAGWTTAGSGRHGSGKAFLESVYRDYYRDKPFVRICSQPPTLKEVRASNYCNIYVDFDERTGNIIVISAIDNLVKGAAGLAVQNMNVMLGFEETEGLTHIPVSP